MYGLNLDPEVIRYTGDGPFPSVAEARDFLERYDVYKRYGMGRLAVLRREDGRWLGWCGLKYHPDKDAVDLGYRFFREFWGQGYATESGKSCLEYGFRTLKLEEIIAHVIKANLASVRVLEKLGFSNWTPHNFDGHEGMQGMIKNPYFVQ
ncbi:GNAT family N-acetyltransferase [Flavilitoribacter nigricans DSM 23189 = NBRC 102662]|uniref:GNAT family N-acetyltransferase n=2 Tax=Flavilitoribacter TaxID=2762562 RepID=A0A2D0MY84_FLAN2|nr:GNAT family N-acetyltransferase [Flavilitoribacter nigricans DSM 23189 = NBRC 102662]